MTGNELLAIFRQRIDDVGKKLVSDAVFLDFLNEAQEEAVTRGNLKIDRVTFTTSGLSYDLDESIYAVARIKLTDSSGEISFIDPVDRITQNDKFPEWRTTTEKPSGFIQYDTHIELNRLPDAVYTLELECYVLPNKLYSLAQEPDLARVHHRKLLYWCYHSFYETIDMDVNAEALSMKNKVMFDKVFGYRPLSTSRRKQFAVVPHRNKAYV